MKTIFVTVETLLAEKFVGAHKARPSEVSQSLIRISRLLIIKKTRASQCATYAVEICK